MNDVPEAVLAFAGCYDRAYKPISNEFGIPREDEKEIRKRHRRCVYCRKRMRTFAEIRARRGEWADQATIEHLNRKGPFYVEDGLKKEHIAICCRGCNSSRGVLRLVDWFKLEYCISRNISANTVAKPIKRYLRTPESRA